MRFHDNLEISEKASLEDINLAYEVKLNDIENMRGMISEAAYIQKITELDQAKEKCISWREESFLSKTNMRVTEMTANLANPNQLNLCIGPCTLTNECCAEVCYYNESACLGPAVVCDIIMWAGIAYGAWKDREDKIYKREAQEKITYREKDLEKTQEDLKSARKAAEKSRRLLESSLIEQSELEQICYQTSEFVKIFNAIGLDYPCDSLLGAMRESKKAQEIRIEQLRREVAEAERKRDNLENKIIVLKNEIERLNQV